MSFNCESCNDRIIDINDSFFIEGKRFCVNCYDSYNDYLRGDVG